MGYSKYRQDYNLNLLPTSVRTNGLVLASFYIPPTKTLVVYNLRVYMSTGGTVATTITLSQDGGAVLGTVITTAIGHATWNVTGPLYLVGAAAGSRIQLLQVTTDVLGVGTLCLDMGKAFI